MDTSSAFMTVFAFMSLLQLFAFMTVFKSVQFVS